MSHRARDYIQKALDSDKDLSPTDFTKVSYNYKINVPWTGSVESNVIFDSANYMPREVTLATTLDIFNLELIEVCFIQSILSHFLSRYYFVSL